MLRYLRTTSREAECILLFRVPDITRTNQDEASTLFESVQQRTSRRLRGDPLDEQRTLQTLCKNSSDGEH